MKLTPQQKRALRAVAAGAVKHAHPFTWAVETDWLDVKSRTLQALANRKLIRVEANSAEFYRPVRLSEQGLACMQGDVA